MLIPRPPSLPSKERRCCIPPVRRKTRTHSFASTRSPGSAYMSPAGSIRVYTSWCTRRRCCRDKQTQMRGRRHYKDKNETQDQI